MEHGCGHVTTSIVQFPPSIQPKAAKGPTNVVVLKKINEIMIWYTV